MKKNNVKGTITKIIIALIILIIVYVLFIYPLIKFNENEDTMLNATKRYYEINSTALPAEGEVKTVTLLTLLDQQYITDLRTAYNGDSCDAKSSFVKVRRKSGQYTYYVYLKCGNFSSNIDHDGPVITLNGKETENVERGEKFKDPGVKSVIDNTDGKIDVKDVDVRGSVNTKRAGTYTITYTAVDSLENKTTVKRKVVVTQNLAKTVEKATDKDNYYKGTPTNNYVSFNGQLFRAVGLDKDGNTKIVATEDISNVDYNSVYDWLNTYYDSLDKDSKKYVVTNYNFCSDSVSSKKVDTIKNCDSYKNTGNAGLLSINEYNISTKEGESYLYTQTINWTANEKSSSKAWTTRNQFFDHDGKYYDYNKNYNFNVRPVLVIKKKTLVKSGSGTASNPFVIGNFKSVKPGSSVNKMRAGEYILYRNLLYRVSSVTDKDVKVISNSSYQLTTNDVQDTVYNPNKKGTIGYLLENEISKQISTKIFKKHKVTVPTYSSYATFSGKHSSKTYNVIFSVPSLYDLYSTSFVPTWFIEYSKKYKSCYGSNNGTVLIPDEKSTNDPPTRTKFCSYLRNDAVVVSGSGTRNDPYVLSY